MSAPQTEEAPSASSAPATRPIEVEYYAQLREEVGQSEEVIQSNAETVAGLFEELDARYAFSLGPEELHVAVNGAFANWDTSLDAQDLVVFIPPVAGG